MAAAEGLLRIEVVCSPAPRQVEAVALAVPAGCTAAQALALSGLVARHPAVFGDGTTLAVWGRAVAPATRLLDGDRLEVCRPLKVDPKEARRVRYRAQGERGRRRVSGSRSR